MCQGIWREHCMRDMAQPGVFRATWTSKWPENMQIQFIFKQKLFSNTIDGFTNLLCLLFFVQRSGCRRRTEDICPGVPRVSKVHWNPFVDHHHHNNNNIYGILLGQMILFSKPCFSPLTVRERIYQSSMHTLDAQVFTPSDTFLRCEVPVYEQDIHCYWLSFSFSFHRFNLGLSLMNEIPFHLNKECNFPGIKFLLFHSLGDAAICLFYPTGFPKIITEFVL